MIHAQLGQSFKGIVAFSLFLLLLNSNKAWKEKPMIVVRHLNGDRFPIILIQMGAIQIRKLNYLQISLQLLGRHLGSWLKNPGPRFDVVDAPRSTVPIVFIAKTATWGLSAKCFKHKHKILNFLP